MTNDDDTNPTPTDSSTSILSEAEDASMLVAPEDRPQRVTRWSLQRLPIPPKPLPLVFEVTEKSVSGKNTRNGLQVLRDWIRSALGGRRSFSIRIGSKQQAFLLQADKSLVANDDGLLLLEAALAGVKNGTPPPPYTPPPASPVVQRVELPSPPLARRSGPADAPKRSI